MPTLSGLDALRAVADTGSMTEAAALLRVTQPTLSYRIATLERELGGQVVDRRPGGGLTTLGAAVIASVRAAVAAADDVLAIGRAVSAGRAGRLRIGSAESLTAPVLAPLLSRWVRTGGRSDVVLDIREVTSADAALASLGAGELDLALLPGPSGTRLPTVPVSVEEFVVVVAPGQRLATFDAVPWSELAGLPFVQHHGDSGLSVTVALRAAREGVALDVVARARSAASVAALAAAGVGVAVVPRSAITAVDPASVRPLSPSWTRPIELVTTGADSPLVRSFVDHVRASS